MDNVPHEDSEIRLLIKKYSPFLVEIKKKLLTVLIVFAISTIVGFIFYEEIIKILINIFSLKGINIVFTSPFQFINLAISCGIATGVILSFPFLIWQILSFLKPALRPKEFRMVVGYIPFFFVLFLSGFLFGSIIMKWQIEIFLAKSVSLGIGNILDISNLLSVVLLTSALMGLAFQFPILLLLLMKMGLINRHQLMKQRMWVYLGSFIFAILLPPDSILSDVLLAMPLVMLFEFTILLNRISKRS